LEALAHYHPQLRTSRTGRPLLVVTLPAETLTQAGQTAVAVVEQATGKRVVSLSVLSAEELVARDATAEIPELVSVSEAADMLGHSRQAVLQMIDRGVLDGRRAGNTYALARLQVEAVLDAQQQTSDARGGSGEAGGS
jgi:excisionase family DNA binding protein